MADPVMNRPSVEIPLAVMILKPVGIMIPQLLVA